MPILEQFIYVFNDVINTFLLTVTLVLEMLVWEKHQWLNDMDFRQAHFSHSYTYRLILEQMAKTDNKWKKFNNSMYWLIWCNDLR